MDRIVLSTLNAKYIHTSFGLRYLLANLGDLRHQAELVEFDIHQRPIEIVERLLARNPRIIGFGVYIWNAAPTTEVITLLKQVRPDITVIIGGPEVSHEVDRQPIADLADYIITGEADLKFAEVCDQLLNGHPPARRVVPAGVPDVTRITMPYEFYQERDIATRVIYVEASRGCPFTCEFCLSSLDQGVRQFPLSDLLGHLERLLERGVQQFKFVDRTFNLNVNTSRRILEFFLEHHHPALFVHFEMIPDRLPEALRELIVRFPPGALQFEVGIQTFNPEVGSRIKRRQNYDKLEDNFRFLRRHTGVHIHADLIVGLPGETVESFAAGFDRLVALDPQEIQVGMLKRLRGAPIVHHDEAWQMVYSPHPPYEILQNRSIDFMTMQQLRRFSRHWDLVGNSGNFVETTPLLWRQSGRPFESFLHWSDWLHRQVGRTHAIALSRLMECLFHYLTEELGEDVYEVTASMWRDYQRAGRSDKPPFLRPYLPESTPSDPGGKVALPKRQRKHLPRSRPGSDAEPEQPVNPKAFSSAQ